jgi:thioredoxin 1
MRAKLKWAFLALVVCIALILTYGVMQKRSLSATPTGDTAEGPPAAGQTTTGTPAAGRVTLIDLGATECIPCKMMAPILEELKKEYAGRADIIFIDVWKDPAQAKKYGIRAIPTQIFFDRDGREVFRHTGFMDKRRIVDMLTQLGVS